MFAIRRPVGGDQLPYIVAAVDVGRLGGLDRVLATVDQVADARCDAIKLGALPWAAATRVFERAERRGLSVLAAVSNELDVERLDWMGAPAFDIFLDWADLDLVACVARTGKPVVMSIANASELDVADAIAVARRETTSGIALVQRVVGSGLRGLDRLRHHGAVVGISDRAAGRGVVRDAIAAGAAILEKRVAPDALVQLPALVRDCELAWSQLGYEAQLDAVN
jgi:N-acetylneuraminate synthase